jgi:hypothetical protein
MTRKEHLGHHNFYSKDPMRKNPYKVSAFPDLQTKFQKISMKIDIPIVAHRDFGLLGVNMCIKYNMITLYNIVIYLSKRSKNYDISYRKVSCVQYPCKVVFLKLGLPHFREYAKSRPTVEKTHCSSPEMYTSYRSCWIMVLVLPTHVFGKLYFKFQKFITYS